MYRPNLRFSENRVAKTVPRKQAKNNSYRFKRKTTTCKSADVAQDRLRVLLGAVERALDEVANECSERLLRPSCRQPATTSPP